MEKQPHIPGIDFRPHDKNWLSGFFPFALIEEAHPLVIFEGRHQRPTSAILTRHTRRWLAGGAIAATLVWLLAMLFWAYEAAWSLAGTAFIISLIDKLWMDFGVIFAGLNSIKGDYDNNRWDPIRVTTVDMRKVVLAKHAIAQVRGWRLMLTVMTLRVAVVVLAALLVFATPLIYPDRVFNLYYPNPPLSPVENLFLLSFFVMIAIDAGVYIMEPRWRLRALAAGSLAVSSQLFAGGVEMLAATGAVLVLWLLQMLSVLVALASLGCFTVILVPPVFVIHGFIMGLVIRSMYNGMVQTWLNRTVRRLVRRGMQA